jgi:acetyl-CoA synthetase
VRFVGGASPLRAGDQTWDEFLSGETISRWDDAARPHTPATVARSPQDAINVLFSSGTTGDPKAIPWDHTTPIKCATDAHLHQDVHPGDVLCWPTSLGWMMGPWLIFAGLINRATVALYAQSPLDKGFGLFVENAGVTMLGLVPSLVRAWRQTGCMEGLDWSALRVFSSSGECSNADDMTYLSKLGGGKPIIEYCGGTEVGGAYVSSTVTAPNVAAAFSTPAFGCDIEIIEGEAYLVGPSMGFSTRLLNRDHHAVYFEDTPTRNGRRLRRHGDELRRLPNGYYRATGRCDDTMNLGGIKVGCTEIERVCNAVDGVSETAAIAVNPAGGGPSKLAVYAILKPGASVTADDLKPKLQHAIRTGLNPLFRVDDVRIVPAFPRTASNKVMRRVLRDATV